MWEHKICTRTKNQHLLYRSTLLLTQLCSHWTSILKNRFHHLIRKTNVEMTYSIARARQSVFQVFCWIEHSSFGFIDYTVYIIFIKTSHLGPNQWPNRYCPWYWYGLGCPWRKSSNRKTGSTVIRLFFFREKSRTSFGTQLQNRSRRDDDFWLIPETCFASRPKYFKLIGRRKKVSFVSFFHFICLNLKGVHNPIQLIVINEIEKKQ